MKRSIKNLDLRGKRVFMRVDFNVPLAHGVVTDDTRIRSSVPSIEYALEHGAARVVLASHLGRPKGKVKTDLSLRPVAARLSELLGRTVWFAEDCVGEQARATIAQADAGAVVLLENLRFHPEEERNDETFARELASLADVYVNDAFGAAHRAHASTVGMVPHVSDAAAGLLMQNELAYLGLVLSSPKRPFVTVLGGAKVSDKIEVIENLIDKVDALLVGGAMAYTFLKSRGVPIGRSLVEDERLEAAREITGRAAKANVRLEVPIDHVVADTLDAGAAHAVLAIDDPAIGDRMGVDIGPKTVELYAQVIRGARTVVWNGPMGVFEIDAFAEGTNAVARAVANVNGTTIIGGGDSIAAVTKAGVAERITHISTGGGASLEFLGGQTLPGVEILPDAG